ncbi:efflux RND transporter permease subunit [Flindersiella endophytica]
MSRLAKLSLANRSLVALASIAVVIFGFVATTSLKQELIPSLQLPMAVTMTTYPGASPEIVEREVTEPIESAISGVDGLEGTTSTSSNGMSVVTAEFTYGTDIGKAVQDLQQSVNRVQSQLPDDADPTVQAGSFDDIPIMALAASSDLDERELTQRLNDVAVPELQEISGVRDVQVSGARTEQVTIALDDAKLAKAGLTTSSISQALQANGVSIPGGNVTAGGKTFPVDVGAQFTSVQQLKDLRVMPTAAAQGQQNQGQQNQGQQNQQGQQGQPNQQGDQSQRQQGQGQETQQGQTGQEQTAPPATPKPVKLSDVATVKEELAAPTSISRTDGKPSLGIAITKTPDGNTVTVANGVKDKLSDLEEQIGGGAKLTVVWDQAPFIEDSIEGLTTEGMLGLAFAILVILIFLLSVRTTLVTAMSIPFSLLVAMIGLYTGGYSLNILTLGALTVAIGRVVDDSIVVLENIKRHIGYGEEKIHAILTAVREVAGAITASTITTVGVFLPIAFVGGQTGELFRPFGVTIAVALLASLLVALTIIPVLAYWFVKPRTVAPEEQARAREEALAKERRNPLQRVYVPVIRWTTKHRVITVLTGIAILAGTFALGTRVQTNFLDDSGQDTLTVTQEMPVATSLAKTDEAAKQVEDVIAGLPEVETYQATVGSTNNAFFGPSGSNKADFQVAVKDGTDMVAFEDKLRGELDKVKDAGELTIGSGGGGGFGSTNVEVLVKASDNATLEKAADQVAKVVEDTPGTTDVTNNLATDQPSITVTPDRSKAAALGLSDAQIGQAVRSAFEGEQAGKVVLDGQSIDVLLRGTTAPTTVSAIEKLEIATPLGQTVPLSDVANVAQVTAPAQVTHTDGERTASVTATPSDTSNLGALTTDLTTRLDDLDLPNGASYEIGGVSQEQNDAFVQLGMAMLAAIAIVFLVMVATFRSLIQPLILLVSVPFAATGAIGLLLLTDTPLGVPALIGLLMLVGIVVTNAIVLIDLINQYREQGRPIREAVIEGGRQRLRPVLMTALATICALVPMALGLTGGGVFISQPLAIVVIGGLVSSTLLTLVLVPTLYTMVESFKERRREKRARKRGEAPAAPVAEQASSSAGAEEPGEAPVRTPVGTVVRAGNGFSPTHAAEPTAPRTATATTVVSPDQPAHITVEVVVRNETT